jgi:hypothetical protein
MRLVKKVKLSFCLGLGKYMKRGNENEGFSCDSKSTYMKFYEHFLKTPHKRKENKYFTSLVFSFSFLPFFYFNFSGSLLSQHPNIPNNPKEMKSGRRKEHMHLLANDER